MSFRLVLFLSFVTLATLFVTPTADAIGLQSVHINLGGAWMGQSYEYDGVQLLDPDRTFSPAGGASVELSLAPPLGLEIGALYVQKGFTTEIDVIEGTEVVGTMELNPEAAYLSIPVLLRLQIPAGIGLAHIVAGPSFELRLNDDDFEVFKEMDDLAIAMQVGAGVEIGSIGVSLRYVRDLQNSFNPPEGATLEEVINDGIIGLFTIAIWRW
jgi:hypothetical protein